jgi:hypothetical protein
MWIEIAWAYLKNVRHRTVKVLLRDQQGGRKRKTWINEYGGDEMDLKNMGVERRSTRILEGTEWASKDLQC